MKRVLNDIRVAIIATDGFEETELTEPMRAFHDAGAEVEVVAPHSGQIQGFRHQQKGIRVGVDRRVTDLVPARYDAVLLPGGALSADALRTDLDLRHFLQAWNAAGRPLGAICHAPWILISAGLVQGRSLTSYRAIAEDLRNAGAQWADAPVVEDRNWTTSRTPKDLPLFIPALLRHFSRARGRRAA